MSFVFLPWTQHGEVIGALGLGDWAQLSASCFFEQETFTQHFLSPSRHKGEGGRGGGVAIITLIWTLVFLVQP